MPPRILTYELQQQYEALRALLQRALWLAERCADFEATQILRARLTNLQSPALLVIVGEVKTGKSSFINALVQEEVCDVAPGPCTTRIQELVYGPERSLTNLGPSWERVSLPKDVLREATIVDTPGTNSIIQNHQAITENYIPQSDLVVFVFSAVNPHTKSAWELLKLISGNWHRKMVFVLQQSDRASAQELATNREHVVQYARERQVYDPPIFTLSAKLEREGRLDSGFHDFRNYLRSAIEGGEVWRMKVEGSYETVRSVVTKLLTNLRTEKDILARERLFYETLVTKVEAREKQAGPIKQVIVQKLTSAYDKLARNAENSFSEQLGIGRTLGDVFSFVRGRRAVPWLTEAKARFREAARRQLEREARRVANDLLSEMETTIAELAKSMSERDERPRENVPLPERGDRLRIVDGLRSRLQRVAVNEPAMSASADESKREISRFAVAGGALALLGIIILIMSSALWLSLVAAAFVATGVILLVTGLFRRRVEMVREFQEKLDDSCREFQARLEPEVSQVVEAMFFNIRQALAESLFRLNLRASQIDAPAQEAWEIGERAAELLLNFQRGVVPRVSNFG
ncbi:MAG: dynamin family protein [Chthoniobacterales bacterium]